MKQDRRPRPWLRTGLLSVGHLVDDGFGGFLAPLLPLLIDRLDLLLTLAGVLGSIRIVTNSVLQPSLGHRIDRAGRPGLVVAGPILTIAAMSLLGRATSFPQLLASSPVAIVAAQECVPGRAGLVSGLVMGLAWGAGGIALTPVGWFADRFGLVSVMSVAAPSSRVLSLGASLA